MDSRDRYDSLIRYYMPEGHPVPWLWAKAQMLAESNANPCAKSPVGAWGLMQFMPATWTEVMGEDKDPRDAELSIQAYSIYMPRILTFLGEPYDLERATAAYNCGMGNIRNWGSSWRELIPTETKQYLRRIKNFYAEFSRPPM